MSRKRDLNRVRRSDATVGSDSDLLHFADQVRKARLDAGLTQEDLALVSGVGRTMILRIENAWPGVTLGKVARVLAALGLRLNAVAG